MKKIDILTKFLEGISSIICLYPSENSRKISLPNTSIYGALKQDWEKVGHDMWTAFRLVDSQQLETNQLRDRNDRFEKSPKHHS